MGIVETIVLAGAAAWGSGINLYATGLLLGTLSAVGTLDLPPALAVLSDPVVLITLFVLYLIEFVVDKIPGLDSLWDLLHTFIRIPAGALLAAGMIDGLEGGSGEGAALIAAFVGGGGLAGLSHVLKSGSRAIANMSPEPFSNWMLSFLEDVVTVSGLALALLIPLSFLFVLVATILIAVWVLPKAWRGLQWLFALKATDRFRRDKNHRLSSGGSGDAPFISGP